MNLSLRDLQAEAAVSGFSLETLDKVIRLIDLLNAFRAHPFLKDRMVLKGGTALTLFVFDLPRLSVDIDLSYVGSADREVMLVLREKVRLDSRSRWPRRLRGVIAQPMRVRGRDAVPGEKSKSGRE